MLLSHLIPPKRMTRSGNKYFKPSIGHSKTSMIKHAKVSIIFVFTSCIKL